MHRDLIAALGGECVICGEKGETAPLTVDHEHGITWSKPHSAYRYDDRVRRYYEEYMRGVRLRCLCMPCNSGYRPTADLEPAPF